ncbi:rac GTPase-activating protein 1 isoform X2 [Cimex lectularius]|uniref:Rac GTPase-activating protein 1 n=1 Tax=Cimex lectularius TaxID=79782 RepID=A0A8I6RTS9_CIMLE|nr:rac GTPase-activating protein 1 isoform X2 [Cimex lectularius]
MDVPKEYTELLAIFDSITIYANTVIEACSRVTKSHIDLAKCFEETRKKWKKCVEENGTLLMQLKDNARQITELEKNAQTARRLLDEEKLKTKKATKERDFFESQLDLFREILKNDKDIQEDTKVKLSLVKNWTDRDNDRLDTITEMETTGSVLDDLSYTRDDDSFNTSENEGRGAKRQYITDENVKPTKKRKSMSIKKIEIGKGENVEKVIATTTVTVKHNGPVSATSVVETVPSCFQSLGTPKLPKTESESSLNNEIFRTPSADKLPCTPFGINSINTRPHRFNFKPMIKGEICNVCNRRIKFSSSGAKCKDCKTVCHATCKDKVPLPCVPATTTPSKNNGVGTIADFTPKSAPMVPALVVHCIKEIEARGLNEIGLYRIPGSDKEVKALKERFIKGKGIPNLSQVPDVHTICGCLKEFLRSLKEPLITQIRWDEFARATEVTDEEDRRARLFQIVSQLPQPNRDTLAYIILHLQKVAESPDCKMPVSNLSKMFGPTIIGYSRNEPDNLFAETNLGNKVMSELISIPSEYWESFMKDHDLVPSENEMHKTPSANSLLNFFQTPGRQNFRTVRKMSYLWIVRRKTMARKVDAQIG